MPSTQDITYNLHKVVFLMDKLADKVLQDQLTLTFSQFRILMALGSSAMCQRDIADYWEMTEAAVSRQIEGLVEIKMLKRVENKDNRRQNILSLTAKGTKYLEKSFVVLDEAYEKMYSTLDKNERKILVDGLRKLLDAVCTKKDSDPFVSCKTK